MVQTEKSRPDYAVQFPQGGRDNDSASLVFLQMREGELESSIRGLYNFEFLIKTLEIHCV